MKTMHIVTVVAMVVGLVGTSSTARAQQTKKQGKFCSELTQVDRDLARLDAIGPNSTVKELRSTTDSLRNHAKTVEKDAGKMKSPAARQFTQSTNQLSTEVHNIPQNMTLAQVKTRIRDDIQNVKQSADALASESGCPTAMRQRQRVMEPGDATGQIPSSQPPG